MTLERRAETQGASGISIALPAIVAVAILSGAFLAVAGHALDSTPFTEFLAVWGLVSLVGTVLSGLEWEASRTSARLRKEPDDDQDARVPKVSAFLTVSLLASGGATLAMAVLCTWVVPTILHGSWFAAVFVLIAVAGIPFQAATRGILAGQGRVGAYSAILIGEVLLRLALVPLLLLSHAGIVAWIAVLAVGSWAWVLVAPTVLFAKSSGPGAPGVGLVASKFGALLVGSIGYASMLMAYPTLLAAIDSDQHPRYVAAMGSAIVMSRLPALLVLPLLPLLVAFFVRRGDRGAASRATILALVVGTAATVLMGIAVGPLLLRVVFGEQYKLSGLTFGVLLLTCLLLVISSVLSSDLVARGLHFVSSVCWLAGAVTTAVALTVSDADVGVLYPGALLVGSVLSFLLMSLGLWLARGRASVDSPIS